MKTFQSDSVRVHVNHQGVYLVIKDSKGRELIFEPPTSSVKQQWVEDMKKAWGDIPIHSEAPE